MLSTSIIIPKYSVEQYVPRCIEPVTTYDINAMGDSLHRRDEMITNDKERQTMWAKAIWA